ncbi:MAG: hypothetical protein K2J03_02390 [Muribaculaceae bacterium]|nr:hypothetical protein [Muribaculaceae bacterium]
MREDRAQREERDEIEESGESIEKRKEEREEEVRSEKVRRLIDEPAPMMVRWGTAVIFLLVTILLIAVLQLPYPYSGGESILRHILTGF